MLDQFSMITRPYTRLNGLKTIPPPGEGGEAPFELVRNEKENEV